MKALTRTLVLVLAAIALVAFSSSTLLAGPPPHPWPHPKPIWYPPVVYPMPKPIVVYRPPVVYTTPVVNPIVTVASNPAPPADIRLTNPAGNRVTLTYTLNGQMVRRLPAGASVQINQEAVIEFDRGGGMGTARYGLTDGAYKFVAAGGAWNLVRDIPTTAADAPVAAVAANPAPGN